MWPSRPRNSSGAEQLQLCPREIRRRRHLQPLPQLLEQSALQQTQRRQGVRELREDAVGQLSDPSLVRQLLRQLPQPLPPLGKVQSFGGRGKTPEGEQKRCNGGWGGGLYPLSPDGQELL